MPSWPEFGYELEDHETESHSVYKAHFGVRGGPTGKKWMPCYVCGQAFREDQMEWFEGKPYGIPCGDHKDIRSILRKERNDTISRRSGRDEEITEVYD